LNIKVQNPPSVCSKQIFVVNASLKQRETDEYRAKVFTKLGVKNECNLNYAML